MAAKDMAGLAIVALVALATGTAVAEVLVGRKIVALAIGPVAAVAEVLAGC